MTQQPIPRIKTKATAKADWYMSGFQTKEGIYYAKGIVYSHLGSRYSKVYEGTVTGIKPATAAQFLDQHPAIGYYASTGWMDYQSMGSPRKFGEDVMASLESALGLFAERYGFSPGWVLVFSVRKESIN